MKKFLFFASQRKKTSKSKWIHAIRRDVGPNFSINEGTRVCSRHFRGEDLQRSLSGKVSPRTAIMNLLKLGLH